MIYVVFNLPHFQEGRMSLAGSGNANISQMRGWVRAAHGVCVICAIKLKIKGIGKSLATFSVLNIHSCDGIGMQNYSDVTVFALLET